MSDKPTYWEFLFCKRDKAVKSKDGAYYCISYSSPNRQALIVLRILAWMAMAVVFGVFRSRLEAVGWFWPNMLTDYIVAATLIYFFGFGWLKYRLASYQRIPEGGDDYREAAHAKYGVRIVGLSIALILLSFAFISSSFCTAYLRSLTEESRIVNLNEADDIEDYSDKEEVTIVIPSEALGYIKFEVHHAPYPLVLTLDGQPLGDSVESVYRRWCWIWEDDYFNQFCLIPVWPPFIRDGSVLEITCDDLHRRWIFKLPNQG